jgi:hypothetical protein
VGKPNEYDRNEINKTLLAYWYFSRLKYKIHLFSPASPYFKLPYDSKVPTQENIRSAINQISEDLDADSNVSFFISEDTQKRTIKDSYSLSRLKGIIEKDIDFTEQDMDSIIELAKSYHIDKKIIKPLLQDILDNNPNLNYKRLSKIMGKMLPDDYYVASDLESIIKGLNLAKVKNINVIASGNGSELYERFQFLKNTCIISSGKKKKDLDIDFMNAINGAIQCQNDLFFGYYHEMRRMAKYGLLRHQYPELKFDEKYLASINFDLPDDFQPNE